MQGKTIKYKLYIMYKTMNYCKSLINAYIKHIYTKVQVVAKRKPKVSTSASRDRFSLFTISVVYLFIVYKHYTSSKKYIVYIKNTNQKILTTNITNEFIYLSNKS